GPVGKGKATASVDGKVVAEGELMFALIDQGKQERLHISKEGYCMDQLTKNDAIQKYKAWLQDNNIDNATKQELLAIADDEQDIFDRFYRDLTFGTGGLRSVMGAGTNRMNSYTVGKATQGLANWL